ncbi:MAG: polysaccharide pyruvyl transferase family protein [Candidatus Cloacimonadia bacterium]
MRESPTSGSVRAIATSGPAKKIIKNTGDLRMKYKHEKLRNKLANIFKKNLHFLFNYVGNPFFYLKIKRYKNTKKIIYCITPPPSLRNIGDHAQAVAIRHWFSDNFEDYLVLEFDKNETYRHIRSIKKIVGEKDLIFLHSGGNLGDRGLWSENARRLIIKKLIDNKVISLPQTIFFSSTKKGMKELKVTRNIYNRHPYLTIIARDKYSFELAKQYFPKCVTLICPDFVLYLDKYKEEIKRKDVLLCLRDDSESILDENSKNIIKKYIREINEYYHEFDTTLTRSIPRKKRENELELALSIFRKHKLVITDRLHGVIFSVITRTPCIAMKTIDHKMTESMKWFTDLNYITFIEEKKQLPEIINNMLKIDNYTSINWRLLYFDDLKVKIFGNEPWACC